MNTIALMAPSEKPVSSWGAVFGWEFKPMAIPRYNVAGNNWAFVGDRRAMGVRHRKTAPQDDTGFAVSPWNEMLCRCPAQNGNNMQRTIEATRTAFARSRHATIVCWQRGSMASPRGPSHGAQAARERLRLRRASAGAAIFLGPMPSPNALRGLARSRRALPRTPK